MTHVTTELFPAKQELKPGRYDRPVFLLAWLVWTLLILRGVEIPKTDAGAFFGSWAAVLFSAAFAAAPFSWLVQWLIHEVLKDLTYRLKQL